MSAQGRERARGTQASEVAQLSSAGDTARAGAGSTKERLGNSERMERLGLRGASQEAEPASAKVQRPAWLGEAGAGEEEMSATGTIDPRLYRLSLPKASRRLERAMAAFEARMRPADEAAWAKWYSKEWKSIVQHFNAINGTEINTAAKFGVHGAQSRRENRAHKDSYAQYLEQLLAGDNLFTWHEFTALWDIEVEENKDNGKSPLIAAPENRTLSSRSKITHNVYSPGWRAEPSGGKKATPGTKIETAIARFNANPIPFFEGPVPSAMTEAEFSVFAKENSRIRNEKSARAELYEIATYLLENKSSRIRVVGTSDYKLDGIGLPNGAKVMGLARAQTIAQILIDFGVSSGQITVEGEQIESEDERGVRVTIELL